VSLAVGLPEMKPPGTMTNRIWQEVMPMRCPAASLSCQTV
jgi:hypothetical protein